ncbi:hypothetical protein GLOTRDRAFT_134228 [Gloeophyllum trabeum ATCC 11539]|uniref:Restriction of telomere capping protein 4 C-terminal domain-containing protein n=1 Tax=Gloeophyllum trabeum (strain ATCC 11539 / FP-39264 / Madison 617) TaxID=670483 RepID=S7PQP2_GLOTA|nr:uncharacterized protein GLOTRDRAFT_134228 [Gloeophyllum trabeum ATCC 11539]EPQ50131.1 hypothetical protein GLOTRDRAFT_134228 [Gloeophyllum trabeum ATCC 11539]
MAPSKSTAGKSSAKRSTHPGTAAAKEQKAESNYQGPRIPKPPGKAGRSSNKGGYNLQEAMGLKEDSDRYNCLRTLVRNQMDGLLKPGQTVRKQKKMAIELCVANLVKKYRFFRRFEDGWPIRDMITIRLQNAKYCATRAHKAEMEASNGDSESDCSNTTTDDKEDSGDSEDLYDDAEPEGDGDSDVTEIDALHAVSRVPVRENEVQKSVNAREKKKFDEVPLDTRRLEQLCLASRERLELVLDTKEESFIWKCLEEEVNPVTSLASPNYPTMLSSVTLEHVKIVTAVDYFGEDGKTVLASTLAGMFPAEEMDPLLITPFRPRSFIDLLLMPELVLGILCLMHGISEEEAYDMKTNRIIMKENHRKIQEALCEDSARERGL